MKKVKNLTSEQIEAKILEIYGYVPGGTAREQFVKGFSQFIFDPGERKELTKIKSDMNFAGRKRIGKIGRASCRERV